MNEEKCFCHLNGFAVKDATARQEIELLKQGSSGGKTYYNHYVYIETSTNPYGVYFNILSTDPNPVTNAEEFITLLDGRKHIVGVGAMDYPFVSLIYQYNCYYIFKGIDLVTALTPYDSEGFELEYNVVNVEDTVTEL